jgi:hypothetical protein
LRAGLDETIENRKPAARICLHVVEGGFRIALGSMNNEPKGVGVAKAAAGH